MVQKKAISIWDFNVDNMAISDLIEKKNNSKYLITYLDEVIRLLVLVLHKKSEYVKTFKNGDGDKDKNENNKLMHFHMDNDLLLTKYKTTWTKTCKILSYQFMMIAT